MTAFALVLACAPAVEWTVDVDVQLVGKQALDSGRSHMHTLAGLRGGLLTPIGGGVHAGFDLGLHVEPLPRVRGTSAVSSVALEGAVWPRGVIGWRAEMGPLALFPYAFAGPFAGARLVLLTVLDDSRNGTHPTLGLRAGGGARIRVGHAHLGLELGAGARESGPEVYGLLTSGFWL